VNILLIQLKRIGDLILTTPAIAALRENFPEAKITLAISRGCASLAPALVGVDQVLIVPRGLAGLGAFWSIFRQKFDYCIDFTRNDRSAFLTYLSRAKRRVVSYRVQKRSPMRRKAYTDFVHHRMHDMHTIDYNMSLLEPLELPDRIPPLQLNLPEDARAKAEAVLQAARIGPRFAVFHPGSARAEKFWVPERWATVIEQVRTKWQLDCALTGGSSALEQKHLARIEAELPFHAGASVGAGAVVDLSGKTDLLVLAALIARAHLLVTVDSAPMHFAAALQTPQVVLFGPTNPFHWRPRQGKVLILHGESAEPQTQFILRQAKLPVKQISTQAVINAIDSLLQSSPTQEPYGQDQRR
jgi:predicted lipopolysaccharide heptosyltransferase III